MKVAVSQMETFSLELIESQWNAIKKFTNTENIDFLLLPELGFYPWIFCSLPEVEKIDDIWAQSISAHQKWIGRFKELNVPYIAGSMPTEENNKRYNTGFVWSESAGIKKIHHKVYLPDEAGFWEAKWYDKGSEFETAEINVNGKPVKLGFLICSELWFLQHAREYGKQGIHLLLTPRSTEIASISRWGKAGSVAGIVSGSFHLSSNQSGLTPDKKYELGGMGWVGAPNGDLVAKTSRKKPFLTCDINLEDAEKAKNEYPMYIEDN